MKAAVLQQIWLALQRGVEEETTILLSRSSDGQRDSN
jgi:hypothetical protein